MSTTKTLLTALLVIGLQTATDVAGGPSGGGGGGGGGRGGSSSSSSRSSSSSGSKSTSSAKTSSGGNYFGARNTPIPESFFGTSYVLLIPLLSQQHAWAIYTDAGVANCSLASKATTGPTRFNGSTIVADAYQSLRTANATNVTLSSLNASVSAASNESAYLTSCISLSAGRQGWLPHHAVLLLFLVGALLVSM